MNKLLVVMLVLGMAGMANATLMLSVDDVNNPAETTINLKMSETVKIDIAGEAPYDAPGQFYLGIKLGGLGSLNIDNVTIPYAGNSKQVAWIDSTAAPGLGIINPFVSVYLYDLVEPGNPLKPLSGKLVDNIIFHCDGYDPMNPDVTLILLSGAGQPLDTQIIHQIPEPMTVALLGLGGLFLRRRK